MICPNPNCRKENPDDSFFCLYCSKPLKTSVPVDADISTLQEEINKIRIEIGKKKDGSKMNIGLLVFILLFAIVGFIFSIINYNKTNDLSFSYKYLKDLNARVMILEGKTDEHLADTDFIEITKIYNEANNSTILKSSEITYLFFTYDISKKANLKKTDKLYARIIEPSGVLKQGKNSPPGYTMELGLTSSSMGWGNDTPGSAYQKGIYTIEIWYGDEYMSLIKTYKIYIE